VDLGLAGRRAIVTGGSKGLGLAIAAELLGEGAAVAICSRNAAELDDAAAALAKQAGDSAQIVALACDVTDPEQVTAFVDGAAAALGGVDILVNNAGGARPGRFAALTDDDWQADTEVKLFSQIRCIRAALPHLRAAPRRGSSTSTRSTRATRTRRSWPPRSTGPPASASPRLSRWSWEQRESW
jgi:Dehydrogenases with different specificities (related to short-chain alcohol dehydrogenases)